jgi:hypothetical protein
MNKSVYALGRLKSGVMNRTEAAYSQLLESLRIKGEVAWWEFEGMTFKLAEGSRYTPDFNVMLPSGVMEMHEVKGRWMDDAKTKIKVAASKFPFLFRAVYSVPKKDGGGFRYEDF